MDFSQAVERIYLRIKMITRSILIITCLSFVIVISGCGLPVPTPTDPVHPTLVLTLRFDKDIYDSEEAISARLVLENIGADSVLIKNRMVPNFSFAPEPVRDIVFVGTYPSGGEIEFGVYILVRFPKPDDFVILSPGETVEHTYNDLGRYYGFSQPGKYSIHAVYQNQSDPDDGRVAWKGEIRSNTTSFTREP